MESRSQPGAIRVILADDHPVVRSALRAVLEATDDIAVVSETGDVDSVFGEVETHAPGVLLLDLNMPGGSSVEAISRLAERHPETRVVVLTMESRPEIARLALTAGASGYVLKKAADRELVGAVRAAAAGETHIPADLAAALSEQSSENHDGLTAREAEVLGLLALGHTSREIAEKLDLSARTVESHRSHIQQKLRLDTRPELVRYALDHGLLPGPEDAR